MSKAIAIGDPAPAGLSAEEQTAYDVLRPLLRTGIGYAGEMANRPQTLYGIADSPVGLAAWMLDHDVAQLRAHRPRLRRRARRPVAGRRPRQRHPLLADEHGGLLGPALLGEQAGLLRRQGRRDPGRRDRLPGRALSGAAELGRAGLSEARSTTTRSTRAATSPPGSSRRCSPRRSARPSGRCGDRDGRAARRGPSCPTSAARPAWLNSAPLTPDGPARAVVVVQFCTFSCVNWLRTLPYVRAWAERSTATTGWW